MTDDGAPGGPDGPGGTPTPAEPITLTDPDGSVTRVASWSSWTREQIRAPGGEPLLVTRLDEGQLWFAAGRRRSPWRHQVQAGPVVVTTPGGRFQVIAEADGGATVVCLAGRTRVVSGLREPVVLGPNQTASVSGDGATLVVTDVAGGSEGPAPVDDAGGDTPAVVPVPVPRPGSPQSGTPMSEEVPPDGPDEAVPLPAVAGGSTALAGPIDPVSDAELDRRSLPWLPEIVAVAAIAAILVAAAVVLLRQPPEPTEVVAGGRSTQQEAPGSQTVTSTRPSTTTAAPTTTEAPATTTTEPASTTTGPVPVTTTAPPTLLARGTAVGTLTGCRRAEGGVQATVAVAHRSGSSGRFAVEVGLVDPSGEVFVTAEQQTPSIDVGGTAPVDVLIPVAGAASGRCELISVRGA